MITKKEILDLIAQYIETQNLGTFAASFAVMFYDIEATGDPDAILLAYEVEAALAAVTGGVCSETALFVAMKSLAPSVSIVICEPKIESQTYGILTKAAVAAASGTVTLAYVDIGPSVGFSLETVAPNKPQTNTDLPRWQELTAG
jgi:hypothetical protein